MMASSPAESASSSSEEGVPLPGQISYYFTEELPCPRSEPVEPGNRRWATAMGSGSHSGPDSGDFTAGLASLAIVVAEGDARLLSTPSYNQYHCAVGSSLLHSCLRRREFPWVDISFNVRVGGTTGWQEWVDHVFTNDGAFVAVLRKAGIDAAIRASPKRGANRRPSDLFVLVQR